MCCRICGRDLFPESLLRYENMPAAAQNLPDRKALPVDKGVSLEVYQCSGCGLVQLNNEPVPYYREVIRASAISPEMAAFRLEQFTDFVGKYSLKGKKIIEIGCGRGEYLSIMQQTGVRASGLEASAEAVAQCAKQGLKAVQGFGHDNDRIADAPFDAFYMLNFLEHLPEPNSSLRGIIQNLAADAVGLVEVPNFDMILRRKLFSEFIGDHLSYFTGETLKTALQLNGFDVIACHEVWHDYSLSAVVKKKNKTDFAPLAGQRSKLKGEIERFIGRYKAKKVAVWGAGHQALAVIALCDLGDKLSYVVDSAPFKQGKFTPATHLRIVGPNELDSDPVEAVIIMAASYSDEIAGMMRRKYGEQIDLAILRDFGLETPV